MPGHKITFPYNSDMVRGCYHTTEGSVIIYGRPTKEVSPISPGMCWVGGLQGCAGSVVYLLQLIAEKRVFVTPGFSFNLY